MKNASTPYGNYNDLNIQNNDYAFPNTSYNVD